MSKKVRWGVLSTADIGLKKVLPAMMAGDDTEIYAISSRNGEKARKAASDLGIAQSFDSYEAMLQDPLIEAVYNPLPNHLHVEWTIKAMEAGKAVLCEKPLALTVEEAERVIAARNKLNGIAGEAFMVASHPQWIRAAKAVQSGELGDVRVIQGFFSYFNDDPGNIRNIKDIGGGGIYDIGCYPIMTSRFILGEEPIRVIAMVQEDPVFKTDRLASVILDFPSCQVSFVSSTQLVSYQRMHVFGTKARLEVEIPFNAPPGEACRVILDGGDLSGNQTSVESTEPCDQYTLQGDRFSRAVRGQGEVPVPLENSLSMAKIYEAIFMSIKTGSWANI